MSFKTTTVECPEYSDHQFRVTKDKGGIFNFAYHTYYVMSGIEIAQVVSPDSDSEEDRKFRIDRAKQEILNIKR